MMNLLKTGLLSLTGLSLVATSAIANPTKWTNSGREYVVIQGLPAGETVEISLSNQDEVRNTTVDACGWIKLSETSTYPIPTSVSLSSDGGLTYGASIDLTTLPTFQLTCDTTTGQVKSGGNVVSPPTQNFIDNRGRRIIVGQTVGERIKVRYDGVPDVVKRRANECGYVQLSDGRSTDLSAFVYNGTTYNLASLPTQNPPATKTIAGQRVCYAPVP